jgi:ATP adenylyltransferase
LKKKKTKVKRKSSSTKKLSPGLPPTLVKRVLFRPDRFQYVSRKNKIIGCVFCQAAQVRPQFDTLCVYKSEHSMIILNKFPYNSGHLLVVPIAHKGHLLKLDEVEFNDLHITLKKAIGATEKLYKPDALNVGLNHGRAAGAGIPDHLHYHLIPRWEGDLNFFPLIAETKAVVESLDQTFKKMKDYFDVLEPDQ